MNWFNSKRVVSIVSLSVVALFLITGFVLAGERTTNYGTEGIDAKLRGLVEAGKITQEQADMKRKGSTDGKLWKGKGEGKTTGEGIDAKLRALVEAGKIPQGQAEMKRKAKGKGKGGKKSIGNFSY